MSFSTGTSFHFQESVSLSLTNPIALLVDGNWGEWSKWSTCSKTCKQGRQSRKRECNSPAAQYGGKKCQGGPSEHQACNKNVPCPGISSCFFLQHVSYILCTTLRLW